MPPKIVVLAHTSPELEKGLEKRYAVCRLNDKGFLSDPQSLDGVRAAVTSGSRGISEHELASLPALELITVFGVGKDKVPVEEARRRGIHISTTPSALTDDVAELAIALLFALSRRIVTNDRYVRSGCWTSSVKPPLARRITGLRVGILGLGRIGSAVADRLSALGCTIAYHSRGSVSGSSYFCHPDAMSLASASDVLIVTASGGATSAHIIDKNVLDALGPDGLLVNVARGSLVDEKELASALADGRLGGAGLDVFEDEPNVPESLKELDSVILQPHQGSATVEAREAMAKSVLENLELHFKAAG